MRTGAFKERDRRMTCEDGSREWSDESVNQGMLRIADHLQIILEMRGTDSPSEPPKRNQPANTLILDFLPL